jgi:hypothetical protein
LTAFRSEPKTASFLKLNDRNRNDVQKQLHQNAQMLLGQGKIKEAWMMLLAVDEN